MEPTPIEKHFRQLIEAEQFRPFSVVLSGNFRYSVTKKDSAGFTEYGAIWVRVANKTYLINSHDVSYIMVD